MGVLPGPAAAATSSSTLVVDADGETGNYTSIQNAVDNASAGDTVEVRDGKYNETVAVGTKNLTVVANGSAVVAPNVTGDAITVSAANVTVEGLAIGEPTGDGVVVSGADDVRLVNLTVENAGAHGLDVADANRTVVRNVSVRNSTWNGVYVDGSDGVTIRNLTVRNVSSTDHHGVFVNQSVNVSATHVTTVGFEDGIVLDDVRNATGTKLNVSDAVLSGVDVLSSTQVTIRDSVATDSSQGFDVLDGELRLRDSVARGNNDGLDGDNATITVVDTVVADNGEGIDVQGSRFTAQNLTAEHNQIGVYATEGSYVVDNSTLEGNEYGAFSEDGTVSVTNTTVRSNYYGVWVDNVTDGKMRNNRFVDDDYGFIAYSLQNYTLRENSFERTRHGVAFFPDAGDSHNDIDTSNTIDGSPIYHLTNATDATINGSDDPATVLAVNSSVTVENVSLNGSLRGVGAWNSTVTVRNASVSDVIYGITFENASGAIENSTISTGSNYSAVSFFDGSHDVSIERSTLGSAGGATVFAESTAAVGTISIHNSSISATGNYGVENANDSAVFDARYNDWGAADGPGSYDTTVSDPVTGTRAVGDGANVSANVRFDPWSGVGEPEVNETFVAAGDPVRVSVTSRNDHAEVAMYSYTVTTDGSDAASISVGLDRGESVTNETTVSFDTGGTHTVGVGDRTVTVTVDANAPNASLAGGDRTVTVGETVRLDGSGSTDRYGIASMEWAFGDGSTANGANVTHTYDSAGTYNATLTVTDRVGHTTTRTVTITVEAEATETDSTGNSGGGGGGQGGGSSGPTISVTDTSAGATISVRDAQLGSRFTADVSDTRGAGVAVDAVGFEMTFDEEQFRVEATDPTAEPQGADALEAAEPVAYFRLDAAQLDPSSLESATVTVELNASALPDEAEPADVTLYRYHDGSWQPLSTSHVADGSYEAEAPGFSAFAVGVDTGEEATDTSTATESTDTPTDDPVTETAAVTETAGPTSTDATGTGPTTSVEGPGFGAVAALAALSLVAVRQFRR